MSTPHDFIDYWRVLDALASLRRIPVIVGGQACNFYAERYLQQAQPLLDFRPFTSRDLDLLAEDPESGALAASKLNARYIRAPRDNPSPVCGYFQVPSSFDHSLRMIQILSGTYGVVAEDVLATAMLFKVDGHTVRVMHPLFLLKSKLACLRGLEQAERQDEKHVKMCVCFCGCFIHEILDAVEEGRQSPRVGLTALEQLFEVALSQDGMHAWSHYKIATENALPIEKLMVCSHPRLQAFLEKRLPQLQQLLSDAREDIEKSR